MTGETIALNQVQTLNKRTEVVSVPSNASEAQATLYTAPEGKKSIVTSLSTQRTTTNLTFMLLVRTREGTKTYTSLAVTGTTTRAGSYPEEVILEEGDYILFSNSSDSFRAGTAVDAICTVTDYGVRE